jgi:hypothetical protein
VGVQWLRPLRETRLQRSSSEFDSGFPHSLLNGARKDDCVSLKNYSFVFIFLGHSIWSGPPCLEQPNLNKFGHQQLKSKESWQQKSHGVSEHARTSNMSNKEGLEKCIK